MNTSSGKEMLPFVRMDLRKSELPSHQLLHGGNRGKTDIQVTEDFGHPIADLPELYYVFVLRFPFLFQPGFGMQGFWNETLLKRAGIGRWKLALSKPIQVLPERTELG